MDSLRLAFASAPETTTVGPPAAAAVGEVKELLQQYLGGINARLDTIESRLAALEGGSGGITAVKAEVAEVRKAASLGPAKELLPPPLVGAPEKKWDVFISHTKRAPGSEQKALMISDCMEEAGMKPFIDLQNLEEISREQLIADVKASKCLVTVIDTEVFNSEWCVLENTTAVESGIPIVPFYDGEMYQWNDISFWVRKHPDFFKIPAVEYHKGYHKQSKALLIAKARGEKLNGLNSALNAMTDVVGRAARSTAVGLRVRLEVGSLPPSSGKLARSTAFLADEVGSLPPSATEHQGVNDALGDLRGCLEELDDAIQGVLDTLPPPSSSGGFGCGGKPKAVAPLAPAEVVAALMSKDVEMAKLRAALKEALRESRRTMRLQKRTSISSMSALLKDAGSASWDDFAANLVADLKAAGAEDAEVASAAEKAASLVPKLKSRLVDAATGKLKAGLVQKMLGTDGGDATQALIDAAEVSSQVERVFWPEVKHVDATTGAVSEAAALGDLNFVMVREGASLSTLRGVLAKALGATAFGPTAASGAYAYYLHDGKTKVAAEEEGALRVFDHVPGLILVPTADAGVQAAGVSAEAAVDDLLCEAQAEAEAADRAGFAAGLTLDDVLADPELVLRFKRVTYSSGLAEENTSFLSELLAVRAACQGLDGAAARALALPRLRTIATVYLVKATSMSLATEEATKAAAVAAFTSALTDSGGDDETRLFAAFEPVEMEVRAACEKELGALRRAVTTAGALRTIGKARRTVVVVGGGIAGSLIARWFDRHHTEKLHVVLVDPKEYHECTLLMLRAVIQDGADFQRRVRCPHTEYVRNGTFIMDACQEVLPDHIRVGSSATESSVVPFDFLILATGCFYAEGIKTASPSMEYRIRQYAAERRKVATAKRVLIIGAGVVGNELCGEIVDAFPGKEVIMVGRSTLLSRCGPEAHKLIAQHWAERGVTCYYHEEMRPYKLGDTHYETVKGTRIPVDGTRAFWCTGRDTPNSGMLAKHFPAALDKYGYVKIDEHCRVTGVPRGNIFACGDVTFGSAHPGGDRGTYGFQMHSFIARENIVAIIEQVKAGTPHELCVCPQAMPFKIDPVCDSGSNAAAVEGFKSISLGHDTYFLTFTAGAKQMVAGSASTEAKEQLTSGEIKSKCYLLKKGGEGRMKNYVQFVDILRSDKDKNGPIAHGFPLNKPGKDAAVVQGNFGVMFTSPFIAKMVWKNLLLTGKDESCMMSEEQKGAGKLKQLLEGDGLEVTDDADDKVVEVLSA